MTVNSPPIPPEGASASSPPVGAAAARGPLTPAEKQEIEKHGEAFERLRAGVRQRIVGQDQVVDELLTAILAEGHCLIVGVPGLAKTLIVSTIAELLSLSFKRIQFTPDLMPSDITGATIVSQEAGAQDRGFHFLRGPIFCNVVLADEINRTPPKTQAALMEAMEERQITAAGRRFPLDRPFFVLATQNPIEQEGTYPLPVSQMDRFLFNVLIDYPDAREEFEILQLTTSSYRAQLTPVLERQAILDAVAAARRIAVDDALIDYAARLVRASRPADSSDPDFVREWLAWGGGPRAIQSLLAASRAYALLRGRPAVEKADIDRLVAPTLRHRIILNYHSEAEGIQPDTVVDRIREKVSAGISGVSVPRRKKGFLARWRK